ncbi:putative ribosome biogenesis protein BMS1 [Schistosoma mansoni]|uniref:putative ribosome biogenesis protein BMS1 n=1 Tax=Schistosoma mansoni TaxID=6183 RepID=UPI00022DC81F|nr:putative ribosome biogenesis protein BMS1 [Schistosoma mansoni]|eukprot:XP_018651535.1 putative ribosome biogenesis protein BMS1 [Schistosoma mansoni]
MFASMVLKDPNKFDDKDVNKKHRPRVSGRKAQKKFSRESAVANNPKAFAVQHTTKASRLVQRTLDHQTKRHHLLQSKYVSAVSPPYIVAIVGPPKSGKSTLLRGLLRHFAHLSLGVIKGPVTVVVGKKERFTFIECGCEINSMLDAAKIADVVLLLVNVRAGLEMYHFEFINMIQAHGMPRVIPVLNHLDTFKDSSSSRALRRKIKHRLWTDLNSKIFLLSRFQAKKCDYLLNEVRRLARLIMVKTPRPSDWRSSHPYLLIDRIEDVTDSKMLSNNINTDRCISLYGWVRGAPLPPALMSPGIHIAGLGDFALVECTQQSDPCPLPGMSTHSNSTDPVKPTRHLSERDRKIYAPMSSLRGVLFDRDATYIDLGGSHYLTNRKSRHGSNQTPNVSQSMLDELHATFNETGGLDERLDKTHKVRMVSNAPFLSEEEEVDNRDGSHNLDSLMNDVTMEELNDVNTDKCTDEIRVSSEEPIAGFLVPAGFQESGNVQKKNQDPSLSKSAHMQVKQILDDIEWKSTTASLVNWNRIVYGINNNTNEIPSKNSNQPIIGDHDFTLCSIHKSTVLSWEDSASHDLIRNLFTTGQWGENEDAQTLLEKDAKAREELKMNEVKKYAAASGSRVQHTYDGKQSFHDNDSDDFDRVENNSDDYGDDSDDDDDVNDSESNNDEDGFNHESDDENIFHDSNSEDDNNNKSVTSKDLNLESEYDKNLLRPTKRQKILEKRQRHKALFNQLYEAAGGGPEATVFYDKLVATREAQQALNREVLKSLPEEAVNQLEGFPPGVYVRIEIKGVPHQFLTRFDPCQPLVAGGLSSAEEAFGYLQIRFRTHRWLKRVLRSNDPLTVSIGWRRYQTVTVFSQEEHNLRKRYLKYSLPHEHCLATIYGPLVPPKTGVIAFVNSSWQSVDDPNNPHLPAFRVAGTGSVIDTNQSFQIMKKLKLIGEPFKIFSKTAFIRGMFNSPLEVSKMIGCRIQTASKIRGLIKAALTNPSTSKPGDFRATFEAQIRKADIVFLRTFFAVELPKYYNPVLNRLLPIVGEKDKNITGWRLLRTLGELKWGGLPINRPIHVTAPLRIPIKLAAALPFADKPKPSRKEALAMLGGDPVKAALNAELPAPVKTADEMESESRQELITRLRQLHSDFMQRQKQKMIIRVTKHKKKLAKENAIKAANERKRRKQYFARRSSRGGKRARRSNGED